MAATSFALNVGGVGRCPVSRVTASTAVAASSRAWTAAVPEIKSAVLSVPALAYEVAVSKRATGMILAVFTRSPAPFNDGLAAPGHGHCRLFAMSFPDEEHLVRADRHRGANRGGTGLLAVDPDLRPCVFHADDDHAGLASGGSGRRRGL